MTPDCRFGFSHDLLRESLSPEDYADLQDWLAGQTQSICSGCRYDFKIERDVPSGCGPHGPVAYDWDVKRWLHARAIGEIAEVLD